MKAALLLRGKIIYSDFQITFQITSDYISDFLLIPDRLKKTLLVSIEATDGSKRNGSVYFYLVLL